jgi:transcriptional regulator with XRE-family HTH domain
MTENQTKAQGGRLKKIRLHLGLSQIDFAILLESTQSHVSKIEKGKASISVDLFSRLLSHNPRININWYITGDGEMFLPVRPALGVASASEPEILYGASVEDRLAALEAFVQFKFNDFPGPSAPEKYS